MTNRKFSKSTVYQIYIKSFADSNGDGIGDINGITDKLDYLKWLGIDYVWITPFFKSPLKDNGYDVSDYRDIDPVFGTMSDVERLIKKANDMNIGLMFDMVFNHTSTEHEWFKKALSGDPEYMDYYIFRDPVDGHAPTNWESKFGGSAWEYVPHLNKYYLHLFDVTQADLNWDNAKVRKELQDVILFWKNKGIKGFRFDVVNLISKPEIFEDDYEGDGRRFYTDGHLVHQYIHELTKATGIDEMLTVGEMSSTSIDNCIRYTDPQEQELSMAFSFHHLKVDYRNGDKWDLQPVDIAQLRSLFCTWQERMSRENGWNALFWCNHDQPRAVSRFGNDRYYWRESAKMLAMLIHLMRGTPYVFQGEEIGVTNAGFTSLEEYKDVESINYYDIMIAGGKSQEEALNVLSKRSRDNGRTPMQWDDGLYASFSQKKPWIGIPDNYKYINVANQRDDNNSILCFYKDLIRLRKEQDIIADGDITFIDSGSGIIAYKRNYEDKELVVICNMTDHGKNIEELNYLIAGKELLLASYQNVDSTPNILRPFEGIAYMNY